ncbi:MAG: hypothetical protein GEU28_10990 [Dehalococcoidia bacterium]|nr:hypothetical protein [Dehalococcoidia bacterium]
MTLFSKHIESGLSEYLDGRLTPRDRARLEDHVAACPRCAAALDETVLAVDALRALPEARLPRAFVLNEAMLNLPERRVLPARRWQALGAPAAGFALLFVLLLGGDLATSGEGDEGAVPADSQAAVPAAEEGALETESFSTEQSAGEAGDDAAGAESAGDSADSAEEPLTADQAEEQEESRADEPAATQADESSTDDDATGDGETSGPDDGAPLRPGGDTDESDELWRWAVRALAVASAAAALTLGWLALSRWREQKVQP